MKLITTAFFAILVQIGLTSYADAQVSKYRGSYYVYAGYTSHNYASYPVTYTFGLGTLTLSSTGSASYTCYFPFDGFVWDGSKSIPLDPFSGSGTGVVSKNGVFSFNNGTTGYCQLWGTVKKGVLAPLATGMGTFADGYGGGLFGELK